MDTSEYIQIKIKGLGLIIFSKSPVITVSNFFIKYIEL